MRPSLTAAVIVAAVHSSAASAQAITNVNECTFLTDPIAIRRCIDGFQLRGPAAQYPPSPAIPPIETPAQAEREKQNRNLPPNTSYRDSPGWLGSKDEPRRDPPSNQRVIDLRNP